MVTQPSVQCSLVPLTVPFKLGIGRCLRPARTQTDLVRSRQENMQQHFPCSDEPSGSADDALIKETAALYLDPRNRLSAHGPDSLNELDTLSLLLGQRDHPVPGALSLESSSLRKSPRR
jgi:hypothetical protein